MQSSGYLETLPGSTWVDMGKAVVGGRGWRGGLEEDIGIAQKVRYIG